MINFDFVSDTRICFGRDTIDKLKTIIPQYGKRVLIVYGGGSIKRSGLLDKVKKILYEINADVFELGNVDPNPRISSVEQGRDICKSNDRDILLPIGGGSTIDCAKIISVAVYYEGDAWDIVMDSSKITKALPIVAISTLSATGSEMNCGAVIKNDKTHDKCLVRNRKFQPKYSILDPTLTFTVPKRHTAAGTVDIFSHTMERYFGNITEDTYLLDGMMEAVMKTCIKYGPIAYNEPDNYDARANLMWASCWAINDLITFGKPRGMSVHVIEGEVCAIYDTIHGEGLAILTPHWMEYVLCDNNVEAFARFAINVFGIQPKKDKYETARGGIQALKDFYRKLNLPQSLSEIGIKDDSNFKIMAEKAGKNPLKAANTIINKDDIIKIYENAL